MPRRRAENPQFVVERNRKYFQEYYAVGFLLEVDGRWLAIRSGRASSHA